eukprot:15355097-Ditylum_brightwellii.AAC.1
MLLRKNELVTQAGYTKEQKLLEQRGCKWAKSISKHEKKLIRMMKTAKKKCKKKLFGQNKYKFRVIVPRTGNIKGSMKINRANGNNL